jgi:hypothetical protein
LRVLRRQTTRLRHRLEARVPALKITAQLLIEHAGPDLQQPVGARGRPTHLLSIWTPPDVQGLFCVMGDR